MPHRRLLRMERELWISWGVVAFLATAMLVLFAASNVLDLSGLSPHYLPLHTVLELIGILTCFAAFVLGWATDRTARPSSLLFLGATSFAVGSFDIAHTLSFQGMPDFVTPSGPNKAIYFWLLSRVTDSFAFLAVALTAGRTIRFHRWRNPVLAGAAAWTLAGFALVLFFEPSLPVMFVPGEGLTTRKILLEGATLVISALAGLFFLWKARETTKEKGLRDSLSLHSMACASLMFAISGFFFSAYRDVDDLYNLAGHIYKALAFAFVYRTIFLECVVRPYEQIVQLAEKAEAANNAKSRFLANVSHEFRTPLGIISGYSEILLSSKPFDPEGRGWMETIVQQSSRLRLLIDDLLDLSKAESENLQLQWSLIQADALLEDVVHELRLLAEKKGLRLDFENAPAAPVRFATDPLRLKQILVNLIGNAIKFTPSGFVRVSMRFPNSETLQISVQDSGIGIDARNKESLFLPFSQVEDSMSRRFGGTGLGLALSKRLAMLLGGDLWLERSLPGEGSLFILQIANQKRQTLEKSSAETRQDRSSPMSPPALQPYSVLVAEDSPENQFLLKRYLGPTGVSLTFVANGDEAVSAVLQENFDLILMDIQMPVMDGFEATQQIRGRDFRLPIVALTAHAHKSEQERALGNGFTDYLVKPISKEKLWISLEKNLKALQTAESATQRDPN